MHNRLIVCALVCVACAGRQQDNDSEEDGEAGASPVGVQPGGRGLGRPRIHAIGTQAVLTFQEGKELVIPITGQDLHDPRLSWSVSIRGVVPLGKGDYTIKRLVPGPETMDPYVGVNRASIVINADAVKNFEDRDPLTVTIDIADGRSLSGLRRIARRRKLVRQFIDILGKERSEDTTKATVLSEAESVLKGGSRIFSVDDKKKCRAALERIEKAPDTVGAEITALEAYRDEIVSAPVAHRAVASGTRRFVLYAAKAYRNRFLARRLSVTDIKAFPMPNDMAEKLFGTEVSDHFYVVTLSLLNTSDQDRLVNTGMINAYGRALVYPKEKGSDEAYTIPIEVSPQSKEQVYKVVADRKPKRKREIVFRSLEFVGALGTAVATSFAGSRDLVEAFAVFTGIGIPQGKKLYPDPVPAHLANIVNYSMAELVKVPKNAAVGFKVLFFPKDRLHSMISDPIQFKLIERSGAKSRRKRRNRRRDRIEHPRQYVAFLAFDTLEIPFENVITPAAGSVEERIENARQHSAQLQTVLTEIRNGWGAGDPAADFEGVLTKDAFDKLGVTIKGAGTGDDKDDKAADTIAACTKAHAALSPVSVKKHLTDAPSEFRPERLSQYARELENMTTRIRTGRTASMFAARVKTIEARLEDAERALRFYRELAGVLKAWHEEKLVSKLVKGAALDAALKRFRDDLQKLVTRKGKLRIAPDLTVPPEPKTE